jgi:hypothetical protein
MDNSDSALDAGSLRYALAHVATPGDTIDFVAAVRGITLTSGTTLTVGTSVNIVNDLGTGPVTIDGSNAVTVFTVNSGVTATLSGLTITHGKGGFSGGGILNNGTLTVSDSTFSANSVSSSNGFASGGGIDNDSTATVSDSTFSGNTVTGGSNPNLSSDAVGGGLANHGALTLNDSTFSANSASSGSSFFGVGGGIYLGNTQTVNGNLAVGNFGGPSRFTDDVHVGNVDPSSSNNVVGAANGPLPSNQGNQVGVTVAQAGLAPLGNYGGPTQTMLLLPGSVALNAGQTETNAFDQRGFARPNGGRGDAGAVQDGFAVLNVNTTANTESISETALSLRDALQLADGNFKLSQVTAQAQAQVTGTPGDFNTINLLIAAQRTKLLAP